MKPSEIINELKEIIKELDCCNLTSDQHEKLQERLKKVIEVLDLYEMH